MITFKEVLDAGFRFKNRRGNREDIYEDADGASIIAPRTESVVVDNAKSYEFIRIAMHSGQTCRRRLRNARDLHVWLQLMTRL